MFRWLVLLLLVCVAAPAQEVPLGTCRELPTVKVTVGKRQFQFLVDTGAAATLVNEKSFQSTESTREVLMDSWNGRSGAPAHEVALQDFSIGDSSLFNLKLLALDLSNLERSCERRVDGVLGADLIAKMGLTIDLKNHVIILDGNSRTPELRLNQLNQQQTACEDAFNRSDDKTFERCLDPDIALLTDKGDFHGRKEVMQHFREKYFGQNPPVVVSLMPRQRRVMGAVIWIEYDIFITMGQQVMKSRSTALYHKAGDRWLMSNLNYTTTEHNPATVTDVPAAQQ